MGKYHGKTAALLSKGGGGFRLVLLMALFLCLDPLIHVEKTDVPLPNIMLPDGTSWILVKIIDGDTLRVKAPSFPSGLQSLSLRLRHVDAPERFPKARCVKEAMLAEQASVFTGQFTAKGDLTLRNLGWDKYGGRVLAEIYAGKENLGQALLRAGLARPYEGKARKGWCE